MPAGWCPEPRQVARYLKRGRRHAAVGFTVTGMASGRKERHDAKIDAAEILAEATERASAILREAQLEAVKEGARLREMALEDAKRIREEAVEEIVKLMSTLTTERDHILADARDDARRIVDEARQERVETRRDVGASTAGDRSELTTDSDAAQDRAASRSELDELFFADAPESAPLAQPRPQQRRRKRFRRHR
jgi:F0F1-type ATP synthase membrane subunit b/b'